MAKQLQLRRGTTVQNDAFTGAIGELTMDTDKKQLRLHDGATLGGCGIIDPVVAFQLPTAENDYTWYRKYASGWVEQGKLNCSLPSQGANTAAAANFTLPVTMANNIYHTTWARVSDGGNTYELTQVNVERNTAYVKVWFWSTVATSGASTVDISISGIAA